VGRVSRQANGLADSICDHIWSQFWQAVVGLHAMHDGLRVNLIKVALGLSAPGGSEQTYQCDLH
jgi:hypothetical protein